jgi:hypothetical protein
MASSDADGGNQRRLHVDVRGESLRLLVQDAGVRHELPHALA